ncbi:MAG: hypothetical protein FJ121_08990 [Deltaproteobacteria bacterium]|nr:hypothetical protein [Deltaproteobacteria bacterium]
MTETVPRFDGEQIKLGDREFVVPPLNWRRIRKVMPIIERMGAVGPSLGLTLTTEMLDDCLTLIFEAVSRNYPDLTRDELEDLVDLVNAPKLIRAIMGLSGLLQGEPAPVEEMDSLGENSTLA